MTILDQIVNTKRHEVAIAKDRRSRSDLRAAIEVANPPRDFWAAVSKAPEKTVNLIAEVKKASPSAGLIVTDFDPVAIAKTYEEYGASAISVLTDETYFQGRLEYILAIKRAVDLPILRKEFIIDEYQVVESRAAGADAVLLISEILSLDEVQRFHTTARELGMTVLVEGHTSEKLLAVIERLGSPADGRYLLGINNRNLHLQKTDVTTTVEIAKTLPPNTPFVSESGLRTRDDVEIVASAGACAILVGESLLKSGDVGAMIDDLLGKSGK